MEFELTPEPTSLFEDGMLRKPDKSVLQSALLSKTHVSSVVASNMYVIDGGALLHRVMWPPRATYGDVIQEYVKFVANKYGRHLHV